MLLALVVETSRRVTETSRRLGKIELLATLLRRVPVDEVETVVAFLSGSVRQGRIGIGWATLRDAGAPAAEQPVLDVREVDRTLDLLAAVAGRGSEERKRELLHSLFARAIAAEQEFLKALLMGEIRQGALEGIMLEALAKASGIGATDLRRAVMMAGDLGRVARSALESGAGGLGQYQVQLFRPVQPMLAQTAEDVGEALEELGEAALEYKFDGARVQVHRSGGEVQVFTRRLNNVTSAVPEIVEAALALPAGDLVLDGEVLSLTPDGRPQPFQVTMRRFGRKLDLERMRAELPLRPFWFDLLYLNGQSLMDEPQARRFGALRVLAPADAVAPHIVTADAARASAFLAEALERGHEGIMAKETGAVYAAGGARPKLVEDQEGAHARPGDPGGGMGKWTAARLAQQSALGRARYGEGRLRHARQDVQGSHRRNACLADGRAAKARDRAGQLHSLCGAEGGGGDCVWRYSDQPTVSGGAGAALCSGETVSAG